MILIGSVGMGLMWGWLLVLLGDRQSRHLARNALVLLLATAVASAQLFFLFDSQSLISFLGAALFALFVHLAWRRALRQGLQQQT